MNLELQGRTAVVTGGSRGIGRAVAAELSAAGVAVADRRARARAAGAGGDAIGRSLAPPQGHRGAGRHH